MTPQIMKAERYLKVVNDDAVYARPRHIRKGKPVAGAKTKQRCMAYCALVVALLSLTYCLVWNNRKENMLMGSIWDADGNKALSGVYVCIKDSNSCTITDSEGHFSLESVLSTSFPLTLEVRCPGYRAKELVVGQAHTVLRISLQQVDIKPVSPLDDPK